MTEQSIKDVWRSMPWQAYTSITQAYYMYKDISTSSGTDKTLMSIFMVVFAVIGAGMVIMGVTKSYKAIKEDYNAVPKEEKKDAETSEGKEFF